jgi:hypothetical protein
MGSSTFHKPFEEVLKAFSESCTYEYYDSSKQAFSKNQSRICHLSLTGENEKNKDAILMIFKICNNQGRVVIQSEGPNTTNKSSTYPKKIEAVELAQRKKWKYYAIGIAGTEVLDPTIHKYVVSIESANYGKATAYDLTSHIQYLNEHGLPDFYRCTGIATEAGNQQVPYTFSFVKKEKVIDYLKFFDSRSYDNSSNEFAWHDAEPSQEELIRFRLLMRCFVNQLNINNELIAGERVFANAGENAANALIESWRTYNGFEMQCRLARGYQKNQDNANYLNYRWVNINPHFNPDTRYVESVSIKTKPNMNVRYQGSAYTIEDLGLDGEAEVSPALKRLFVELRDEVYKWQTGVYDATPVPQQEESPYVGQNLIVYGTPGCGKSHYVDNKYCENAGYTVFRTTFHPEYTYTDFIGQVLPIADDNDSTLIHYEFVPGTFTRALETALNNNQTEHVALIIEEINRGNAAAIFGDIFQLLDRKSSYFIHNEQLERYLIRSGIQVFDHQIQLPHNLDIIATMNTGDQNVFTLDTAFKRRWKFIMMENDFDNCENADGTTGHKYRGHFIPGMKRVTWEAFVDEINKKILQTGFQSEDKQIGMFFFAASDLCATEEEVDNEKTKDFAFKIFEYLWNDVAKLERDKWFRKDIDTLSKLIKVFCSSNGNGGCVFANGLEKTFSTLDENAAPKNGAEGENADGSTES